MKSAHVKHLAVELFRPVASPEAEVTVQFEAGGATPTLQFTGNAVYCSVNWYHYPLHHLWTATGIVTTR